MILKPTWATVFASLLLDTPLSTPTTGTRCAESQLIYMMGSKSSLACCTNCQCMFGDVMVLTALQLKNLRKETADLLAKNQLDLARVRVEAVMREVKTL